MVRTPNPGNISGSFILTTSSTKGLWTS